MTDSIGSHAVCPSANGANETANVKMKQQTNQSRLRDQRNPTVSKYRVRSFIVASHHEEAFTLQIQYCELPEVQHKTHRWRLGHSRGPLNDSVCAVNVWQRHPTKRNGLVRVGVLANAPNNRVKVERVALFWSSVIA